MYCALSAAVTEAADQHASTSSNVFSLFSNLTSNMKLPAHPASVSFGGYYGLVGSSPVVMLSDFPRRNSSHISTARSPDGDEWVVTTVAGRAGTFSDLVFRSEDSLVEIILTNVSFVEPGIVANRPPVTRRVLQSQACPSCSPSCINALRSACHLMFGRGAPCLTCTGTHQSPLRRAGCSNENLQQYCAVPPPPPPAPKNSCWHTDTCACSECNCAGKTRGGCSNAGTAYCDCFGYCSKCH